MITRDYASTRADCERLDAAWKNSRRQKKTGRLDDEKLAHRIHATELSIGPVGIAGAKQAAEWG